LREDGVMKRICLCVIILFLSCLAGGSIDAAGLRTTFVEVILEDLEIGGIYNITELINLPLVVENTGDEAITLRIDVVLPSKDELKEGYEPIPDPSWIKVSQDVFEVEPRGKAVTDVIISIPDDERYVGGSYQVWIWSHTIGPGMIGVGLKSRILFSIAGAKSDSAKKELSILPTEVYITDVEVGKVYDVKKEGGGVVLKVFNLSKEERRIEVEPIKVENSPFDIKEGYVDCPNPSFLIPSNRVFTLPKAGEEEVGLYIAFPKKEEYRGKGYMFVIRTTMLDQPTIQAYSKVYVLVK
jgi:hypothetical protein